MSLGSRWHLPLLFLTAATACRAPLALDERASITGTGVVVTEVLCGLGPGAHEGETIVIDYVARLTDDTAVDSTYERGLPVSVQLGSSPIAGWNSGLLGLALGGKRRLLIPAVLAFGSSGVPGLVPPDADLVFEIERVRPLSAAAKASSKDEE